MKRIVSFYSSVLLGVAAAVAITHALEQPPRLSVVADLPPTTTMLDMSGATGRPEPGEELSGGATSVRDTGMHAFGRGPMNLASFETTWTLFREGRKIFDRNWYAKEKGHLLLGPKYNAGSCSHCHESDGRGRPPLSPDEAPVSMVLRLGVPQGAGSAPEPTYGEQLGYYAVDGVVPEGSFRIDYDEIQGRFADDSRYSLRVPTYTFRNLGYGPMAPDVRISPRVAPATFGLGLLEAVPERAILALADPNDRDRNGISGRPNYVTDVQTGKEALGRFGWKANQPSIAQQILKAFNADIGITSRAYPDDGPLVRNASNTGDIGPELSDKQFDLLLYYMKLLAVPERRNWMEPAVQHGKAIFRSLGCAGCHAEKFVTDSVPGYPELSGQTIRPYTDMLLHDMGDGLADNRPDGLANGREWRTPPLWGIGLVKAVSGHTLFLHDGRARNLEEAILWHGGEGAGAQNGYRRLQKNDRTALLKFLESL